MARDPRGLTVVGALISDVLNLSYCTMPVPLRLRNAVFKDVLTLVGATITGQFELTGAELNGRNNHGNALAADLMRVDGDTLLAKLNVTGSAVRLMGANITGALVLTGAELNGKDDDGDVLVADRLRVDGGAFLKELKVTGGAVRLTGATIKGHLDLTGAKLNGNDDNDDALAADRVCVNGDALLSRIEVTEGAVRLLGATITGQLKLLKAELNGQNDHDNALAADRIRVDGSVFLKNMKVAGGATLALRYGRLGNLVLDDDPPPGGWHRYNLVGLRYEQIHGGPAGSARQGAHLLASQADRPRAAQPYWQLADYYARVGNESAARRLRVWSNVQQSRAHLRSWPRFFYGLTTGFGYYPFLALLWLAVVIGIDAAAVNAHRSDFIPTKVPTVSALLAKDHGPVNSSLCDSPYPCFDPTLYATDTVVPVISLGQQDAWRLDTSRAGVGIQVTLLFTATLGRILTTLLIGGIGGLLRGT